MIKKIDIASADWGDYNLGDGWKVKSDRYGIDFYHDGEWIEGFMGFGCYESAQKFIDNLEQIGQRAIEDKQIFNEFFERTHVTRKDGLLVKRFTHESSGGDTIRDGDSVTYDEFVPIDYGFLRDYSKSFNVDFERLLRILNV